jgi:hypothetical protein
VTASMWVASPVPESQVRNGEPMRRLPRLVNQTNGGRSTVIFALCAQPALHQRSRSPRAVRYVRPIRSASWSSVTAYCSAIRPSSSRSRSET